MLRPRLEASSPGVRYSADAVVCQRTYPLSARLEESSPGVRPLALTANCPSCYDLHCLQTGLSNWPRPHCLAGATQDPASPVDVVLLRCDPVFMLCLHPADDLCVAAHLAPWGHPLPAKPAGDSKAKAKAKNSRHPARTPLFSSDSSDTPSSLASPNEDEEAATATLASSAGLYSMLRPAGHQAGPPPPTPVNAPAHAGPSGSPGTTRTSVASGPPVPEAAATDVRPGTPTSRPITHALRSDQADDSSGHGDGAGANPTTGTSAFRISAVGDTRSTTSSGSAEGAGAS